jgi:hypothetical protein
VLRGTLGVRGLLAPSSADEGGCAGAAGAAAAAAAAWDALVRHAGMLARSCSAGECAALLGVVSGASAGPGRASGGGEEERAVEALVAGAVRGGGGGAGAGVAAAVAPRDAGAVLAACLAPHACAEAVAGAWADAARGALLDALLGACAREPGAAADALATLEVPPPSRTKWTRRVPHPVLTGHAASLTPY